MKNTRIVVSIAAAAFASSAALAADIEAGKKKVQEVCAACHGIDGGTPTTPDYPKLAGQYPDYLAKALRDYKSGRRKNPIMAGMAQGLTDKDIENVSEYFYVQPSNLASKY
ncbi:MAG TPA: cytochrome c [Casimicrobiaceae bacterium]|nr:cytochrome c [Casimicrobiaceae bacterium]